MTLRPIRRALLSTSDKTGVAELGWGLARLGVELVSTGGTAATLRAAGLQVVEVSALTGAPEMLDGRVKTLHPAIHGGILARRDDPTHRAELERHGIGEIDLVVVNLYPFEARIAAGAGFEAVIEEIDIGGVALIRAAAKNHASVAVLTEAAGYAPLLARLAADGGTDEPYRRELAARAFARTAAYDAAIAGWFAQASETPFPERLSVSGTLRQRLRYGENPHQRAAFYVTGEDVPGLGSARQLQGKELSYNNLADADSALSLVAELDEPAAVIVKHANPCGVAVGRDVAQAYARALACDPTSAFGGIVATNRPLDAAAAEAITKLFTEVVIAPGADEAACRIFATKPNLRLLALERMPDPAAPSLDLKSLQGGFLVQSHDTARLDPAALKVVTRRCPSEAERNDLLFAWACVKHVRSNAILLAREGATIGIGMGQTSRVDAVELAVRRAAKVAAAGACVLASDAFFPFADGLNAALQAGVTAVIQPGGSVRDSEVIEAADKAGVAMLFTGTRHFRH